MIQGSGEWMHARAGNVGASNIWRIMGKTKNGYSAEREKYMKELLVERLTGEAIEHYVNDAMQWGIAQEGMARSTYEAKRGIVVQEVGFILHPTITHAGLRRMGLWAMMVCLKSNALLAQRTLTPSCRAKLT